jgi:integrating conjugative element protein (TIGR03755 family)
MNTRFIQPWLILFFGAGSVSSALAQIESPTGDGLLYYQIGGGRHISIPPSLTITTINLSASANWRLFNCGEFDPAVSIRQSLDNLADGVDDAINAMESAVSAAIVSLPGYLLQKANPGLYDLFQNGLLRANESFSLATKSCERMQYEISNNVNPYADWVTMSWGDSWRTSIGVGEENIHNAADTAENAHNDGVVWIGGIRRGGSNQQPIRVLSEVGGAGMNILSQRPPETTSDLPSNSPLRDTFRGPSDLGNWIVDVLGDTEISICDNCQSGEQPGRGLIPYIETQAEQIARDFEDVLRGVVQPTRQNLDALSAPGIAITAQAIEAVRQLDPIERGIVVDKIAQDIARTRVIEEALLVRRFLLTGIKEGNVAGAEMAKEVVQKALAELDDEIRLLQFERNARKEMVSDTIVRLLMHHKATNEASVNIPALPPHDDRPLRNGVVQQ